FWPAALLIFTPVVIYMVYSIRLIIKQDQLKAKVFVNLYLFRDVVSFGSLFYSIGNHLSITSYGIVFHGNILKIVVMFTIFFSLLTLIVELIQKTTASPHRPM